MKPDVGRLTLLRSAASERCLMLEGLIGVLATVVKTKPWSM
jgi:hypothetical protein